MVRVIGRHRTGFLRTWVLKSCRCARRPSPELIIRYVLYPTSPLFPQMLITNFQMCWALSADPVREFGAWLAFGAQVGPKVFGHAVELKNP